MRFCSAPVLRGGLVSSLCLALCVSAGPALAGSAPAPVPVVTEAMTMFELVPGTEYLNGGIGQGEQQRMHQDARHWPLRMVFSAHADNEYAAGVQLKVFNHQGRAVLRLKDAGPMTYVQLPPGDYRIDARYQGQMLTRQVHVGPEGLEVNLHWA